MCVCVMCCSVCVYLCVCPWQAAGCSLWGAVNSGIILFMNKGWDWDYGPREGGCSPNQDRLHCGACAADRKQSRLSLSVLAPELRVVVQKARGDGTLVHISGVRRLRGAISLLQVSCDNQSETREKIVPMKLSQCKCLQRVATSMKCSASEAVRTLVELSD